MWIVSTTKEFRKAISKLPKAEIDRIKAALGQMAADPWSGDVKRIIGTERYRRRVGDWRIIFQVFQSVVTVEVIDVRRRNERTYE